MMSDPMPTAAGGAGSYDQGYAAFAGGLDLSANPYTRETADHLEWENGWSEARDEAEKP